MTGSPIIIHEIFDIFQSTSGYALTIALSVILVGITVIIRIGKGTKKDLRPSQRLSAEEQAALIAKWTPEPLIADNVSDSNHTSLFPRIVEGRIGKRITVDGKDCLNLGSHNYLGLLEDKTVERDAIKSLRKYGVGSCGPRGFYGTVDVHLELEERLAKFMKMEEAVLYSYGFSTIASVIPAYSKRKDICFVDEGVHFAIQKGLDASRSTVVYFKHNDMHDLEQKLIEQDKKDAVNKKKAASCRKFLIVESIYMNTGQMCPLEQLVELRKKYKLRLFLDESLTFGVLGKTGRGLVEHLNIDKSEIDLINASLEWGVGSIGGFCVGSSFIVDHQRLSGLGYCFSASLPPLLAQACISALDKFEQNPTIFEELRSVSQEIQKTLERLTKFTVGGHPLSPVKHLYLNEKRSSDIEKELLNQIVTECQSRGLCLVRAQYLEEKEINCPRPSIRVATNRLLTKEDVEFAFNTLESVSLSLVH